MLYFDVFNYPLSKDELYQNSAITISCEAFERELKELLNQGFLKEDDGFILSLDRSKHDLNKRLKGNEGAKRIMNTALRYSHKIASFPFVEGLALSGSISKNYFDKDGDIDFFVVTKPNRLWICRTLLMLRFGTMWRFCLKREPVLILLCCNGSRLERLWWMYRRPRFASPAPVLVRRCSL